MVILSSIRNDTILSYNIYSFIENLLDGVRQILTFWSKKASESKKWAKNILPEVWSPPIWLINDDTFLTVVKGQHTIRLLIFFIEAEYTRVTNVVLLVWRMEVENLSLQFSLILHYGTDSYLNPWKILEALHCSPRSGELRTQKLKSHLVRTQSLNVLPFKPGVGQ